MWAHLSGTTALYSISFFRCRFAAGLHGLQDLVAQLDKSHFFSSN